MEIDGTITHSESIIGLGAKDNKQVINQLFEDV
jgi:hypothetical protein